jgi:hypothetical protein
MSSEQDSLLLQAPFGKAAFFPGRMIHTNELLVLSHGNSTISLFLYLVCVDIWWGV